MKNLILTLLLLSTTYLAAQPPNGGMRQRQNQNRQLNGERDFKIPTANDIAGIFYYDVEQVLKKLKIKNDETKAIVSKALRDYNFKVKEVALLNSDNLKAIDVLMKSRRGMRRMPENDNSSEQQENENGDVRQKMGKLIRPIRRDIGDIEVILNETLESILSKKQNKKWVKYQKNEKEKLKPQRPEGNNRNQNRQQPSMQNRQRRF